MSKSTAVLLFALILFVPAPMAGADEYPLPDRVSVLPVFFVPSDQAKPTAKQKSAFLRHMRIAQKRYEEMLSGRDTFQFEQKVAVYEGRYPLLSYRPLPGDASPELVGELLEHYKFDRFTCPHVFMILIMNPCELWPAGGGRPFNGGFNLGGGLVEMSSHRLDHGPGFQSTLQHELGHSFGLMHVDVYGYSMEANASVMSYNPAHQTSEYEPSKTPGTLIPEDIRALAQNKRVFPRLSFDAKKDVPTGYEMKDEAQLPPMAIPGETMYEPDATKRESKGFALLVDGKQVLHEPSWNRLAGLSKLRDAVKKHAKKKMEGRFDGNVLHLDEKGYQLFFDGQRVGYEPAWTTAQGVENLRWNRAHKPKVRVEGRFNGVYLQWAEPSGYELFYNGNRVGHELKWNKEQALENLRFNEKRHDKIVVAGRFHGERLDPK